MSKRVALGPAIKAIREAKAETRPEFAGSRFAVNCLMSHAQLCNIEAGRRRPSDDHLYRIATHLGVPLDAISYAIEQPMEAVA